MSARDRRRGQQWFEGLMHIIPVEAACRMDLESYGEGGEFAVVIDGLADGAVVVEFPDHPRGAALCFERGLKGHTQVCRSCFRRVKLLYEQDNAPGEPRTLFCPSCGGQHIDRVDPVTGTDWAARPHHTHLCEFCGELWRPERFNTTGSPITPGRSPVTRFGDLHELDLKNTPEVAEVLESWRRTSEKRAAWQTPLPNPLPVSEEAERSMRVIAERSLTLFKRGRVKR